MRVDKTSSKGIYIKAKNVTAKLDEIKRIVEALNSLLFKKKLRKF